MLISIEYASKILYILQFTRRKICTTWNFVQCIVYNENCFESFSRRARSKLTVLGIWRLATLVSRQGVLKAVNEKAVKSNHVGRRGRRKYSEKRVRILKGNQFYFENVWIGQKREERRKTMKFPLLPLFQWSRGNKILVKPIPPSTLLPWFIAMHPLENTSHALHR